MSKFKGLEGLRAYKAMMVLVRSLWFLAEVNQNKEYEEFLTWFDGQEPEKLKELFKVAVVYGVKMDKDELLDLLCFCTDNNGVKISKENINNLEVKDMIDKVVGVCLELCEIKVFF